MQNTRSEVEMNSELTRHCNVIPEYCYTSYPSQARRQLLEISTTKHPGTNSTKDEQPAQPLPDNQQPSWRIVLERLLFSNMSVHIGWTVWISLLFYVGTKTVIR